MRWPLWSAIAIYLALVGTLLRLSLLTTGGDFTYAQDDPYIHLSMARTLAEYGVWGIRPTEFASASSSPLWTLLLAALWRLGAHAVWVPFLLNIVAGVALLAVIGLHVQTTLRSDRLSFLALSALVLVTPLPTLAFIGMEHTLQILLAVVFARQAAERLAGERDGWLWPSVTAALLVATRYEGVFLVTIVGAVLAWRGRFAAAVGLGLAAAAPVVGFALYSVAHGGLILPNSVLMKSGPGRFSSVASGLSAVAADWIAVRDLFLRPPLVVLTIGVLIGLLLVPSQRLATAGRAVWLAVIFLGASFLHSCLVKQEWFFRYEAYLIALGMLALVGLTAHIEWPKGRILKKGVAWHPATVPLAIVLALPLGVRALGALAQTRPAVGNVFEQQIQMGRFFARFYPDRVIAINDIGAVAWLSSSRVFDIVGLATAPVADLKRRSQLGRRQLAQLADAQGVEAIALYENIFASILPTTWVKAGEWTIANQTAVSGDTITFFGRTPEDADRLRSALDAFSGSLPTGVRWSPTVSQPLVRPEN